MVNAVMDYLVAASIRMILCPPMNSITIVLKETSPSSSRCRNIQLNEPVVADLANGLDRAAFAIFSQQHTEHWSFQRVKERLYPYNERADRSGLAESNSLT